MPSEPGEANRPAVGLMRLLVTFVRLGTMTFGGSLQSWIHREVVERLGWIDDREFLAGMAVSRIVPGANAVNVAVYIGLTLRGGLGAAVAVLGMIVPAFCVILCLGYLYRGYGHLGAVHFVLAGLAAAGVGATLTMGIKVAQRLPRDGRTALVAVAVFVLVGVVHLPMIPVVLAAMPLSFGLAYLGDREAGHGR